ncbi:glycosyltransferase WbuB [Bacillus sp. FJAT-42376]|nr:glycosyltransferase WbuB [Bacillus sp. FJAT-42376]
MTELCKHLQSDFDITVIAAQPGYAGQRKIVNQVFEKDYLENIKIIRIRLPEVDKTSKVSRIKYIFSYFLLAILALLKERDVNVIYTISQPPVLGGLIGTVGKFLKRSKHIYNVQDFNPEQAAAIGYTNKEFIYKIAKKIDMWNCKFSDKIIVVGNDMSETLKSRFSGKKVPNYVVINNWTNEKEIIPLEKTDSNIQQFLEQNGLKEKFIVMYSGNIGLYYDLENIIRITEHFIEYKNLAFVFIGEGAVKKEMQTFVQQKNVSNVYFLPYQPKEFIKYSLNAADVHLVVNQKGIKGVSVPSKIYGVMGAGKPILGVLEQGSEAQMLISKSNCGLVVEPKEYIKIIETIQNLYNMDSEKLKKLGRNGRDYLDQHLKREISINKYREVLRKVSEIN